MKAEELKEQKDDSQKKGLFTNGTYFLQQSLTCADQNNWAFGILHERIHSHPETLVFFKNNINLKQEMKRY